MPSGSELKFGGGMDVQGSSNPKAMAERGEKIYDEKYRSEYEQLYRGKFVAIDITTANAFLADTAEGAFAKARAESPKGVFHLIKVGQPGAFRVSYTSHAALDWLFR
jgi:hypothetical protein